MENNNERKLVAIGGGKIPKWSFETKDDKETKYETKAIDEEIVRLSGKANPRMIFIGTASKENEIYFNAIKDIYVTLGAEVTNLSLEDFNEMHETKEEYINRIRVEILNSDIIYIGGGNTKYMIEKWKEFYIEEILKEALADGTVLAGFSAGSYIMFKFNYELIQGMDLISMVNIVHYDEKSEEKKESFRKTILDKKMPGIALDNGIALEVIDDSVRIIKALKNAKAYFVKVNGEEQELLEHEVYSLKDLIFNKE